DLMGTFGPRNFGRGSDPVQVIRVNSTSFTFLTLLGHHRGAGQTISFETYENSLNVGPMELDPSNPTKIVWLAQYGTYVASWSHPFITALNVGANMGAGGAWWLQAHNLRVALGTEDGTLDKVLRGPRDVFYHF
ncbi:MAG: hypothetical protein JWR10_1272, partial [Rubritepida sp.]|nr:hypothetical protein [Rubritepida sp.]